MAWGGLQGVRIVLAAALSLLVVSGCRVTATRPAEVRWDLRTDHGIAAVQWPAGRSVYEIANATATILLPGGRTFRGEGVHLIVFPARDRIQSISIRFPSATVDDAYRRAKSLAGDWQLRTDLLEAWYQEVQHGRRQGVKDTNERFPVLMAGQPLAAEGPAPYGKILNSFDTDRPALLDLDFQWSDPPLV